MLREEERVTMVSHQTEPRNLSALFCGQAHMVLLPKKRSPAQAGLKSAGGGPHLQSRRRNTKTQ